MPATEATPGEAYVSGELWLVALQLLGALAVILPLVYLATRIYSRRFLATQSERALRVLEAVPLGPNRSICIVEVGDRLLVVGSTAHQITAISEIDDPKAVQEIRDRWEAGRSAAFPRILRDRIRGNAGREGKESDPS